MKDILIEINRIVADELERANKVHPLFHSDHEGVAVIEEEIMEAKTDFGMLDCLFENLKSNVYRDNIEYIKEINLVESIRNNASLAAAELIQVIAMCDKFEKSQEVRDGSSGENH